MGCYNPHHGLVEINTKARLWNVNDVFIFSKQCEQVYYTCTLSFNNDHYRVNWLFVVKTKPKDCVQVI